MTGKTLYESMKKYFKKPKFDLQFILSKKQAAISFFVNYFIPILIILGITIYYFQKLFPLNGILAYNDYVLPISKSDLDAYLSNLTIYNINNNLGSVRTNFLSDIPTLLMIKILSFFVDYQLATKFTQVASFALVSSVFYIVLRKINKSTILSFLLSLLVVFNLWSFDRLEQGHYYLLGPFLSILALIIYFRYYSQFKFRSIIVGHLLFLGVFAYYHYAVITIYFLGLDFFINLYLVKEKRKWIVENIWLGVIFFVDMMVFILPYTISSLSTFRKLSDSVSNLSDLRIFSWQSMGISETFQIRLGMYSYKMISNIGILILVLVGFLILYFYFFKKSTFERNIEKRLKISFVLLGLLGFAIWLNFDLYSEYIYKIPTFAIFRDMNKFVGIAFVFFIFILSHKCKEIFEDKNKKWKILISLACIFLISFVLVPYDMFLVYNQDEIYHFTDESTYGVFTFPSYPLTSINYNSIYYHKYLPALVSTNNLRTFSIPYTLQKAEYSMQLDKIKSLYVDFDKLTKNDIYSSLANEGIKYIIYYKRYEFKSNVLEYDEWMKQIDLNSKLSSDEVIFENSDLKIYQIPQIYLVPFVTTDNSAVKNLTFSRVNNTEISAKVEFTSKSNLKLLTNYDPNWKFEIEDSSFQFPCVNQIQINSNLPVFECKFSNNSKFNLFDNAKIIMDNSTPLIQNYSSEDGFNEWTLEPEYLKTLKNKSSTDKDGITTLNFKLRYIPNSYFVIGFWILAINVIVSLGFIYYKRDKNNIQ